VTGRGAILVTTMGVAAILLSTIVIEPTARYIWNASESVPIGLYRLRPVGNLTAATLVAVRPPEPLARFLESRRYLPRGIPLLKQVSALPGQTVCREELAITVDQHFVGEARLLDRSGRSLPVWQGCHVVAEGELFLMNRQPPGSLDGRYFGVLPSSAIIGKAEPLWTGGEP
jgi:conjugative transfer signal peptidase TraF